MDFDFGLLAEIAENAPVAGGNTSFTNYGRTWLDKVMVSKWNNDTKSFEKNDYTGGQVVAGSTIEFQLHQEIEKKDGDKFTKTWYVQVKESGKRAKDKTAWGEWTKPSIVTTFKTIALFFKAMSGEGSYCAIEDYFTGKTREDKNGKTDDMGNVKEYDVTAPKFVEVFKNKKEMDKAKAAKFAKKDNGIPAEVIGEARGLLKTLELSVTDDEEEVLEALADGYPDVDSALLLAELKK